MFKALLLEEKDGKVDRRGWPSWRRSACRRAT